MALNAHRARQYDQESPGLRSAQTSVLDLHGEPVDLLRPRGGPRPGHCRCRPRNDLYWGTGRHRRSCRAWWRPRLGPKFLVVVVPDAATTASRRPFTSANWASRRCRSARSSLASSLRAVATAPAGRVVLFGDLGQALRPHGGHGHRTGVVRVVLVDVAVVEQACPGGQLRLDVEHPLTGRDELLGEQVAEAGGVLYRPGALGPGLCPLG
jgi:hypothetical protein